MGADVMWDYTDKVMDHFKNPRNVGEIKNADGTGQVGSLVCGDALKLTIKVDKQTEKITDIKFKTFGCASAIASSSVLTEMAKGKTLDDAAKITNRDIAKQLGELPEEKMHCSVMGMEALDAAIKSYRAGGEPVIFEEEPGAHIICKCFNVSEETIIKAIRANNLTTIEDVTHFTKAGGACGQCKGQIRQILNKVLSCEVPSAKLQSKNFKDLTIVEKIKTVEKILNEDVKPKLNLDGGSVELVDINDRVITVRLLGMCAGCAGAGITLKNFIEKVLREKLYADIEVKQE
jgi:NifU-like protein